MILPNAELAIVEVTKLREYCLNSEHPRGRHKARVFRSALGLTADNTEILLDALQKAFQQKQATLTLTDGFGDRYVLDFEMEGPTGRAIVRSTWIVRADEGFPRLTSCYVLS